MSKPLIRRLISLAALLGVSATGALFAASVPPSKADADSMQRKLLVILVNGQATSDKPRRTPITESEVNSYFKYHAADRLPAGLVDPQISILGDGRLSARAIVDLDAVRQRSQSWTAAVLTGKLPVSATGRLRTRQGIGRLQVEAVEVAGVSVPKPVLQELLSYYSRTPDDPDGVSLDDPFPLPAAIQEITLDKGRAVIVQ